MSNFDKHKNENYVGLMTGWSNTGRIDLSAMLKKIEPGAKEGHDLTTYIANLTFIQGLRNDLEKLGYDVGLAKMRGAHDTFDRLSVDMCYTARAIEIFEADIGSNLPFARVDNADQIRQLEFILLPERAPKTNFKKSLYKEPLF